MKAFELKALVAAIAGICCQIWGVWDQLMTALLILVTLDVVTGFLRAFVQQELSSEESFRGMAKKVLIFVMIAVAVQIDTLTGLPGSTRQLIVVFYCASEGLSILENSVAAGMPVPEFLRQALKQLNEGKFKGEPPYTGEGSP